jgi:hypothetical protein
MRGSDFHQIAADNDRPGEIPAYRGDRRLEIDPFSRAFVDWNKLLDRQGT